MEGFIPDFSTNYDLDFDTTPSTEPYVEYITIPINGKKYTVLSYDYSLALKEGRSSVMILSDTEIEFITPEKAQELLELQILSESPEVEKTEYKMNRRQRRALERKNKKK